MRTHETPQSICSVGVARCDITPPVGIYHRMWGAATHERAAGVHRPLLATALVLVPPKSPADTGPRVKVMVSLDHCLLGEAEMKPLQDAILVWNELSSEQLLITLTHTHGAGLMSLVRGDIPGRE